MMKLQRKSRRLGGGMMVDLGGADGFEQRLEIRLPEWQVLRLAARSVLLSIAVLSFPWMGTTAFFRHGGNAGTAGVNFSNAADIAVSDPVGTRLIDDVFFLPMLFRDLKRHGVFRPGAGRAVFLGSNAHLRLPFLKRNMLDPIGDHRMGSVPENSVEFVFADDNIPAAAKFIDRVLKAGGIAAIRINADSTVPFKLPGNYRTVYVRRYGSTVTAMRKTASIGGNGIVQSIHSMPTTSCTGRKLLMVPQSKEEALKQLEDALLEPPRTSSGKSNKYLKRTKYLPDLMGDTLDGYPRRVLVDVGPPGQESIDGWFEKHYPTRNRRFEIIRVEETKEEEAAEEMTRWLRRNVKEEEYVVMKAEAEVVEELVRSRAIGLVDELFLECRNQWEKGGGKKKEKSRRAYWECLALFGKLRDEGIAVHQWWG